MYQRIFVPLMILLLIQAIIFPAVFQFGGFFDLLKTNALNQIVNTTDNRILYLQSDFAQYYYGISDTYKKILNTMDQVLADNNASYDGIQTDSELNNKLVAAVAEDIIYILRRNDATGAFIILDGPGIKDESKALSKPGFYVSNSSHTALVRTNEDLLAENGMPNLCKSLGIGLSSYWSATVNLNLQSDETAYDYFHTTLETIRQVPKAQRAKLTDLSDYGYWCTGYSSPSKSAKDNLYYTLPLISKQGDVLGVVGICFNNTYLLSLLNYRELSSQSTGSYALCVSDGSPNEFRPLFTFGPSYKYYFPSAATLSPMPTQWRGITQISAQRDQDQVLYCAFSQLDLYNATSPYNGQSWYLMGMVDHESIFSLVNSIEKTMLILSMASCLLALLLAGLFSRMMTAPIKAVVESVKKSDPRQPVNLPRLDIREIDDLTASIEALSGSVSDTAAKLNKIVNMTGGKVGVYEHVLFSDTVFTSAGLGRLLNLPMAQTEDSFISAALLMDHLSYLKVHHTVMDEEGVFHVPTSDGSPLYVRLSTVTQGDSIIGMVMDVTQDILKQLRTAYERDFDVLTNLYNIHAFASLVDGIMQKKDTFQTACMIMFDLDNLKYFNDTYGHDVGDLYIQALAGCISHFKTFGGICARRSGDEFLVFLHHPGSQSDLRIQIRDVWNCISNTQFLLPDGSQSKIRVSAGIAWYPNNANTYEGLLRKADHAMYEAKRTRKGGIMDFAANSNGGNALLISQTSYLDQMLDDKLVKFAFQPIVRVTDASLYGYEMLMRPQMKEFKTPVDLIKAATAQGKLYRVESLTWLEGMATYAHLVETNAIAKNSHLFVNSVANQWLEPHDFELLVSNYRPYLSKIILELTETEPLDSDLTTEKIAALNAFGAMLALDDFGSGYASESLLLNVHPNIIKVDMSIVRDVDTNASKRLLLENLIRYAKAEGIWVLAEGVETEAELRVLLACGVDFLQGYYIGKPSTDAFTVSQQVLETINQIMLNL